MVSNRSGTFALSWPLLIATEFPIEAKYNERRHRHCALAFGSGLCHPLHMSTKHTKSEKSQKADELEKRLDDRPEENEKKPVEREKSSRADIDSIKH
jgi:hypothetical protein